jgi:hypothetical protein
MRSILDFDVNPPRVEKRNSKVKASTTVAVSLTSVGAQRAEARCLRARPVQRDLQELSVVFGARKGRLVNVSLVRLANDRNNRTGHARIIGGI